jgi:hypothetical protein
MTLSGCGSRGVMIPPVKNIPGFYTDHRAEIDRIALTYLASENNWTFVTSRLRGTLLHMQIFLAFLRCERSREARFC